LLRSSGSDHPLDDLARFGYRLDMKVEKTAESFYILGYLLELIIKIWRFGGENKIEIW
jgi:hypothetical protein